MCASSGSGHEDTQQVCVWCNNTEGVRLPRPPPHTHTESLPLRGLGTLSPYRGCCRLPCSQAQRKCPDMGQSCAQGWGAPSLHEDFGPVSSSLPRPFRLSPPDSLLGLHLGPPLSSSASRWSQFYLPPFVLQPSPQGSPGSQATSHLQATVPSAIRVVSKVPIQAGPTLVKLFLLSYQAPSPVT